MTPGLLLLGSVALPVALAAAFLWKIRRGGSPISRVTAALGLAGLAPLFFIGAVWPSPFTVAGLLALPAALVFLVSLFSPRSLGRAARWYLVSSVLVSPLSFIVFAAWLES
ncbi:MAG: hypothetical protein CL910_02615 [Deltaproteobacteria bacterium]|jgi:hypothetical protein|nr:hypothetical protein [Deltaproteobacteria bacterium]